MEETLKRKAHEGEMEEEKMRRESNHDDDEDCKDEDVPNMDNELQSTKEKMNKAREENQRLKTCLEKIMSDYQRLQTQFNNVVHEKEAPKKSTYRALDHQEHHKQEGPDDQFDVSLTLGRSSSNEFKDSSPAKAGKSTNIVEQDREGLGLGLDCGTFDTKPSLLTKQVLVDQSSPQVSRDDVKEEEDAETCQPQKSQKASEDDEVSQQNPAKKARVSVRVRCNTTTMNDGCQWRKYGQKIAKGNPCPRAYYRCSVAPSCPVRKQVQRCSQDMSILITTYEGKHNHTLPIAAHAMASTTTAAVTMLLSGSSTSSGASSTPPPVELHGLNYYLSNSSTSSRSPPFYLPNPSFSSSSSCPSITLDLTSSSSSMTNFPLPLRYNTTNSSTNLNFSTLESNTTLPISWGTYGTNCQFPNTYNKNIQMGSSLNFGRQPYNSSYMQKSNNVVTPNDQQSLQMDHKHSIESATKAITADPNFQAALAAALTTIIGSNGNNNTSGAGGDRTLKFEQSYPVLSSFLSTNSQASNLSHLSPPLLSSSSKSKSTSPEQDSRDQAR